MEIFDQLGIKPLLLVAQIVNFLVLLFLLNKFLYKPLLKMLQVRKDRIAESLKNAEEIEKRLEKIVNERERAMEETAAEVRSLIDDANKTAVKVVAQAHEKADDDAKKLILRAQQTMKLEKDKLQQEIRDELATLVILGLQKVTGKMLSAKDQKELIKQSLKGLK